MGPRPTIDTMALLANRTVGRSRALGLVAISLGFLMITLDATIVNVALGPIGSDLGGALSTAQWIINGYTLAFAALLLSARALADRLGSRTGFLVGLAVFGLGSAACACASSLTMLIVARVVQGAGAAALMPCSLALIAHTFPDSRDGRRALGVWSGASGIGLAAGPVLGGILTAALGSRAIFLVNLPIAVAAAELLRRHVRETPRHRHPLDLSGQILATGGLAARTGGFITAGSRGWDGRVTRGLLTAGLASAAGFAVVERAVEHPMVDLHRAHGLDALQTGLTLLPMTIVTGAMALLSGRLVAHIGEWNAIVAGLTAGAARCACSVRRGGAADRLERAGRRHRFGHAGHDRGGNEPRAAHRAGVRCLQRLAPDRRCPRVAVLGALLVAGSGQVSLHAAFLATAGVYAAGVALALTGRRRPASALRLKRRSGR